MREKMGFVISFAVSWVINLFGKNPQGKAGSILIFRLDHMGDMVYTFQAIENLRDAYPNSKISLVTGSWNRALLVNNPGVDSLIIYDSPMHARNREEAAGLRDRIALLKLLWKQKFDLVISFRDDLFTIFVSLVLFPQFRRDAGTVRILTKLRRMGIIRSEGGEFPHHEMDTNREVVLPLIREYRPVRKIFYFAEEEEEWVAEFLRANKIERGRYAILHPGASWKFRRWDYMRFQEVGRFLYDSFHLRAVVIGSGDEEEIGRAICGDDDGTFLNAVGTTALRQSMLMIANAALTVCNDSGPMHLSCQMGKLTVCLLGPADFDRFGPRGDRVIWFQKRPECYPCKQSVCVHPDLPCVNLISSTEVKKAIEDALVKEGYERTSESICHNGQS